MSNDSRSGYRIDGQTWEEWATELFKYQYCDECGGDVPEHEAQVLPYGFFARCKYEDARLIRAQREQSDAGWR